MKKVYLDQKDNYQKNFGIAYRSSSIFYFKKNSNFNTIINFMDYWKLKKSLNVATKAKSVPSMQNPSRVHANSVQNLH